ncbi:hypothetical protein ARC20_07960 [Stenotrophomonas panacihumi]|uniref:Uncharacterized protein n=1 Tax=Stenotrophomonas panacihumi TaxID=676599 RepID=A0A0R0AID6_9GAMM|nr:hypothetical protein [Stenotrophomonas panacihumi]KRG44829.1 hypothetical protein ARC20_07960 [Stenotrophomonas panacihumi]PTN54148.1 hypothetical protein C9J98_11640 [Stenotrophomonas panacihumi]
MKYLVKPVLVLSAIGLLLSVLAHITALLGIDLHLGDSVFVLHGGVFLVWLPTVLLASKMGRGGRISGWSPGGRGFWKQALSGCPAWMRYTAFGLFGYAMLNFFLVARGVADGANDASMDPAVIRGFSGHWMVFYYFAFAITYSVFKKPELLGPAVCSLGHKNWPGDKFCPECGNPIVVRARK